MRTQEQLAPESVRLQAEALAAYLVRGGCATRWLDSKDLGLGDRARILVVVGDLEDEKP